MLTIDLFDLSEGDTHSEPLDDFISRLSAIRDKIPLDRRAAATVEFLCYGDYAHTYADVKF